MGNNPHQCEIQEHEHRKVYTNQSAIQYGYNEVKSTSSTCITFIPLNLISQLRTTANLYFVLISILQAIPAISVTGGRPTNLLPLSFVMLTVLIKDAYEQFCRYLKDREQNSQDVEILTSRGFMGAKWENLTAGDVIKIKQDEVIPCDCLVLKTSLQGNKCFMETKNLDGETNLKLREAVHSKHSLTNISNRELFTINYPITLQHPNPFLNDIKGSIQVEREQLAISTDNVILRGCYLRNTAEAIVVCLYVGSETKLIQNNAKFSAKKSKLMAEIDKMVIGIFIWQLLLSLVVSLFNTLFENSYPELIHLVGNTHFWLVVPSWWLIMTYFVPISLIVTMEMIKLFQGFMLSRDQNGYSEEYETFVSANNTSVNENLGQIKYVFTDKTGTLTKNQMNFKKIVVDGRAFGNRQDISLRTIKHNFPKVQHVDFRDSAFLDATKKESNEAALRVLYLCHDIFVSKAQANDITYNSSSPDEIALANFAKLCGKEFIGEEDRVIRVYDHETKSTLKFHKLAVLYFSSDRKRMSVIIRLPNNQIEILMKGADSIVEKRLAPSQRYLEETQKHLDSFSVEGLRTLLLARRIIPEAEFNSWHEAYKKAESSLENREENLAACYELIQRNMQLIGGTAVEDKLQDQVPETITQMKNAGIKFFILTGDKKETAVNIGRSCSLIDPGARIISYPEEYNEEIKQYKGQKVYLINASKQLPDLPADLFSSQTICYRCTPVQKQNVVRYVKEQSPDLTLAIGDGANDVNMITAADVGIGVRGKEGTEACKVADIAIGEFKFLSLMTLYYGREWYRKNSRLVCYNFFKNWYHVAAVIIYGAYSYFSTVVIYDIYSYQLFNVFFTSVPIILYAVFDEEYTYAESKRYADIYRPGLLNAEFNQNIYYQNVGQGVVYGMISLIMVFMVLEDDVLDSQGRTGYLYQSGAVLFFNIIIINNLKVLNMCKYISPLIAFSVFGSIATYWLVYWLEVNFLDTQLKQSFHEEWETPNIYFMHITLIFLLTCFEYAYFKYHQFYSIGHRLNMEKKRNFIVDRVLQF